LECNALKIQWTRVAHTSFAALVGLAPFVPELAGKLGVDTTVGVWAGVILIAGTVTKVSQIPVVSAWLKATLKTDETP